MKMMRDMKVQDMVARDVMNTALITTSPGETLSDVLGKMRTHDIHELPVVKGGRAVGLVSYSTLIKRRSLPLTTKVKHLMTLPPSVGEDQPLPDVAETLLTTGYRGVPVSSTSGRLIGIISRHDLVRSITRVKRLQEIKVKEIMSQSPHTVSERDTVDRAKALMAKLDVKTLPVVDAKGRITGVVGIKDIAARGMKTSKRQRKGDAAGGKDRIGERITTGMVMRSPALTIGPEDSIGRGVEMMMEHNISTLIVCDDSYPTGILTEYDVIEFIASFREEKGVYVQITGLDEADVDAYDVIYGEIQKTMNRIAKLVTPRVFTVHAITYHESGGTNKCSLRGRLTTEHEMYYAKAFDWSLFRALALLLEQLERQIRKDKERRRSQHRRISLRKR
ncbi:MAG: CBS domain-containing protein [Candidatus Thermoplasmatota archaeon]